MTSLLEEGAVLCHPFVIGELACGSLRNRNEILSLLATLPQARVAEHAEVLELVDTRQLHGRGLGWVDVHLLASALLSGCRLWTLDKPLKAAATQLGVTA
jgi:predicted nucleic acid-binding protein